MAHWADRDTRTGRTLITRSCRRRG
jgi:hypothetical protein